ncbi:hypothetical protein UT300012_22420 [Paraclostridium bifermentans]
MSIDGIALVIFCLSLVILLLVSMLADETKCRLVTRALSFIASLSFILILIEN